MSPEPDLTAELDEAEAVVMGRAETGPEKHLWEYDHPYYCREGNFYKADHHTLYGSWDEFTDETLFFSGDRDQNLLIRWDWISWRRHPDPDLRGDGPDDLLLFFVLQRKAILCSAGVAVTDEDEPRVRWFLEECARTTAAIWEPVALAAGGAAAANEAGNDRAPAGAVKEEREP